MCLWKFKGKTINSHLGLWRNVTSENHDSLIRKKVPVGENCISLRWKCRKRTTASLGNINIVRIINAPSTCCSEERKIEDDKFKIIWARLLRMNHKETGKQIEVTAKSPAEPQENSNVGRIQRKITETVLNKDANRWGDGASPCRSPRNCNGDEIGRKWADKTCILR